MYSVFPLSAQSLYAGFVIFKGYAHPAQGNFFLLYVYIVGCFYCFLLILRSGCTFWPCVTASFSLSWSINKFPFGNPWFFAVKSNEYTICDVLPLLWLYGNWFFTNYNGSSTSPLLTSLYSSFIDLLFQAHNLFCSLLICAPNRQFSELFIILWFWFSHCYCSIEFCGEPLHLLFKN